MTSSCVLEATTTAAAVTTKVSNSFNFSIVKTVKPLPFSFSMLVSN